MLMDTFRKIVNELYSESFNTTIMEDIKRCKKKKVIFGNSFCFIFSKTCFWEYKEKTIFLYF